MKTRRSQKSLARACAELEGSALKGNYRAILAQVPGLRLLPMIKADAYGHGAVWAANTLLKQPGLLGFGVATPEEGAIVRAGMGTRGVKMPVLVFSGALPWTDELGRFCLRHGLTPVLGTEDSWARFLKGGWPARLDYELKFNTGMNRLGLRPESAAAIARSLARKPAGWRPGGILTHLAIAETPEHPLSVRQREGFRALRDELRSCFPEARFHLANSAAIWHAREWRLAELSDVARPGLSLYGVAPWPDAPLRGIRPVMTAKARVLAVHELSAGESVGYGATFAIEAGQAPVRVAILGMGYADGFHRTLSGQGHVWLSGRRCRVLGRVSMDMTAVECAAATRPGDWAEWLGPNVEPWALARQAGTNPYELLTSISARVQKRYG